VNAAVAAQRLQSQRISKPGFRDPAALVAWFGAVQAQELPAARWGLGLRMPHGATDAAIQRALDEGRILRTHVMRPTWHFVTPEDIRWMLQLTAPQVHRRMALYNRHQGLDAATCRRATDVFARALRDGRSQTRAELGAELHRTRIAAKGVRLALLTEYAELEGVICSGPQRGKQITYALLADRAAATPALSRDEALAELTRRYFRSHAPATVRDFVWWSGLATGDARRGLEMIRARASAADGLTYWTLGPERDRGGVRKTVVLLPIYDEYLVAYRDREAVPHAAGKIADRAGRNVTFQHALVIAGQVAGTWRIAWRAGGVVVDVISLKRLTASEREAIAEAAERYGEFVAAPVSLAIA